MSLKWNKKKEEFYAFVKFKCKYRVKFPKKIFFISKNITFYLYFNLKYFLIEIFSFKKCLGR